MTNRMTEAQDLVERLRAPAYGDRNTWEQRQEAATHIETLSAELEKVRAERDESEGVIAVWRRRTQEAEASRDQALADLERCKGALERINALGIVEVTPASQDANEWEAYFRALVHRGRRIARETLSSLNPGGEGE